MVHYRTFAQSSFCVKASSGPLSDIRADYARADYEFAYETRVGSPLDFQLKRVSAPSCFRARCAALKQVVAQTRDKLPTFGALGLFATRAFC